MLHRRPPGRRGKARVNGWGRLQGGRLAKEGQAGSWWYSPSSLRWKKGNVWGLSNEMG